MIKRILGEDNGLALDVINAPVFLCPSRKNKVLLYAKNSTEYDMHLYFSFNAATSIGLEKRETDLFVPAEGNSTLELVFDVSADERMYMGNTVLEFAVKDRVLEWTEVYELELFTETVFKCSEQEDYSKSDELLFSRSGVIYLDENECALIEAACEREMTVIVEAQNNSPIKVYADSEESFSGKVKLKAGLTRLCIQSESECSVKIKDENGKNVFLNTVNPKYFL